MSTVVKAKPTEDQLPATSAIDLATDLLRAALQERTKAETARAERMQELVGNPTAKSFAMSLADRLYRSRDARRAGMATRALIKRMGGTGAMPMVDRWLLRIADLASRVWASPVIAAMRARLRRESSDVILSAEPEDLTRYLESRQPDSQLRANLNLLGEAVLSETDAEARVVALEALLARPDVDYISVKVSAIASQINLLAWDRTLAVIKERLRRLFRVALAGDKLVNLDMEEYRDLRLTVAAFCETLDEPEFAKLRGGIVLQAYLPDSWSVLQELTEWAAHRADRGGVRPKVRLVKGANLAMENVEAEMHGWHAATYATKEETDANFKRMLEFACEPEHARVLRVGVGSHNLFDVALALVLRKQNGVEDSVEIEMLEGMANHQARAVASKTGGVLLYAPVTRDVDFDNALAYLIRRLDENTAPENFLSELFALTPGSQAWTAQAERFRKAWDMRHEVSETPRRTNLPEVDRSKFFNEPDTDWTQVANREQLAHALASVKLPDIPPIEGVNVVIERARLAQSEWEQLGVTRRAEALVRVGEVISARRMALLAVLSRDGSKSIPEADSEISEAVDFARYYARAAAPIWGTTERALGVVVITPPWNFPFAIPAGGVLAALATGNTVILKPAPETVAIALALAEALWAAGIPRDVLQFFPCADGEVGRALITDPRVSAVVLTGSYETARMFLDWRPSLRLYAETSGKNALIVSALADRDLAIKDLVRSAFGHNGQKCSAASLAILEAEVYDDPAFRRHLRDAAASLEVGPAEDLASVMTPLITKPGQSLSRALTSLDAGEEWLLEPRKLGENLWSPGIRLGVQEGSWFHQTECFGPVLGLMRARDLNHAIKLQNAVAFGLTAGLHSLQEDEVSYWMDRVAAGNLYVNRAITGAIVQRQPFGGWKKSSIGPGAKAGGPNYTRLFVTATDDAPLDLARAEQSYRESWTTHFGVARDPSGLRMERNLFRYRPCRGVVLRLNAADPFIERLARLAAEVAGVAIEISRGNEESDTAFAARLADLAKRAEFLRTIETPSDEVLRAAHAAGMNWIDAPISGIGRLELTRWLREQAVSITRHRYGNVLA